MRECKRGSIGRVAGEEREGKKWCNYNFKKIRKRKCNISNHTMKLFLEFKAMNATSLTLVSQIQHDRLFEPDNFGRKKNGLTCCSL